MFKPIPLRLRLLVFYRAKGCCEYCIFPASHCAQTFAVEHILPLFKGGSNAFLNLALACWWCNSHKWAKTEAIDPVSQIVVPLFHPRQDDWKEHFAWSQDFTQIHGLTPKGRATIEALKLNAENMINLRKALVAIDVFPPEHSL